MNNAHEISVDKIRQKLPEGKKIVFVSGNFNVVHPGHLRVLNFAADCGDLLVVGVYPDSAAGVLIPADLRLNAIKSIGIVDEAVLLSRDPSDFIRKLKPDIVVKGKEFERQNNPEKSIVEQYGGSLVFASGDSLFSSFDLLRHELYSHAEIRIKHPSDYFNRHNISIDRLSKIINSFSGLKVLVIGDLILDEYITCDPLGMSQEDPTIVVTPLHQDLFVGGAGIVAAHAVGMGARVSLITVTGADASAQYALDKLHEDGVEVRSHKDATRPTTLKQRYRARGKTLLRVSHLKQHSISTDFVDLMMASFNSLASDADLVIFSDFNYGCLPQLLVDRIVEHCSKAGIPFVADSQSSSQMGDISRFKGALLLTPTEREARLATHSTDCGLIVLADSLKSKSNANHIFLTLGEEGLLVHSPSSLSMGLITDQIPALNMSPKDVSGAGDSMLISAAMSLVAGASIWEAAYIGSIAAACQVGTVGNTPLLVSDLVAALEN